MEKLAPKPVTQTGKILQLLKERGAVTNVELNKICFRFSARIMELRQEGHVIKSNHIGGSLWSYVYFGEAKEYDEVA